MFSPSTTSSNMLLQIRHGRSLEYSSGSAAPRFSQDKSDRLHASMQDRHLPSLVLPATRGRCWLSSRMRVAANDKRAVEPCHFHWAIHSPDPSFVSSTSRNVHEQTLFPRLVCTWLSYSTSYPQIYVLIWGTLCARIDVYCRSVRDL
jgi:hypothetical protein